MSDAWAYIGLILIAMVIAAQVTGCQDRAANREAEEHTERVEEMRARWRAEEERVLEQAQEWRTR